MLLRRRCIASDFLCYFSVTVCAITFLLVCTILYGTRSENPSLPDGVLGVLPAGRCLCQNAPVFTCDTCLDCAANQWELAENATSGSKEQWAFTYPRDAWNYGLSDGQCQAAFPGLFEDIDRAKRVRTANGRITEQELLSFKLTKGMVRGLVFNGELYILETVMVDSTNRQKAMGALHSLHRSIASAPDRSSIPNAEFVISVEDLPMYPDKPMWVLSRRSQDHNLWLIPDFGFWSWDVPQLGTFSEVSEEAVQREKVEHWDQKEDKLVWRGKTTMGPKLRRALLAAARGKSWSDVGQVRWTDPEFKKQYIGPVDQCNYKYIAHVEGRSYSGALKYRQLCRSVVVAHKLQWIQHFHYLMRSSGSDQNFVEVERDFSDLDGAMQNLLKNPKKAKKIADNSVRTFRERYLTGAAEACYWRQLLKGWSEVSFSPALYEGVEKGEKHKRTQKRGIRFETFALFDTDRQMEYPNSA